MICPAAAPPIADTGSKFFALTGPHNASCTTSHIGGNVSRYTCFSCHEHQPDQIRAKHAEEGSRTMKIARAVTAAALARGANAGVDD